MKLLRLSIKDFQAHEAIGIDFSPTITTIVGATDKGKSSIIRALRWICLNDFSGDEFIREGAKQAGVMLLVRHDKANHEIARTRGGATNTYFLNGEDFRSFASSVPDPIANLLSLSEINFQAQHDSPFWFCLSAPEVSRRLNAVIDLSVIDTTLANIWTEVRRASERVTFRKEELQETERKLAELTPQKDRIDEFANIKQLDQQRKALVKRHQDLRNILASIDQNQAEGLNEKASAGEALLEQAKKLIRLRRSINSLKELIKDIEAQNDIDMPPDFSEVDAAFEKWQLAGERWASLRVLLTEIDVAETKKMDREGLHAQKQKAFELRTRGQDCPTCGKPL